MTVNLRGGNGSDIDLSIPYGVSVSGPGDAVSQSRAGDAFGSPRGFSVRYSIYRRLLCTVRRSRSRKPGQTRATGRVHGGRGRCLAPVEFRPRLALAFRTLLGEAQA